MHGACLRAYVYASGLMSILWGGVDILGDEISLMARGKMRKPLRLSLRTCLESLAIVSASDAASLPPHPSIPPSLPLPLHPPPLPPPPYASSNLTPSTMKIRPFLHVQSQFSTLYLCIPPLSMKIRAFLHVRCPFIQQFPRFMPSTMKFCLFLHVRCRFTTLYLCIPPLSLKNRPFLHGRLPVLRKFPCFMGFSMKISLFLHGRAMQGSDRPGLSVSGTCGSGVGRFFLSLFLIIGIWILCPGLAI